jgi:hypothetical protein
MHARDISDATIVDAVKTTRGRNGVPEWATTWDVLEHLSHIPPKIVMRKLQSCIRRGIIGGHACSVSYPYYRGDFELIERDEPWV